ncbi:DUF1934 domain-containing protein [Aquibacillus sp. 3ASR75-11]|uniref:DUF1934 domain-containing protein n=1 Tax=Terrihalobacillus insolitus TaxID=2950438 RepID=A0A9X3WV00_9BACI|nr:DUF1934 domain-containing protein [Terrihalobacillus insolitus]MDC3414960.1 DUF1934 domain-containing protein [Terrihalobacillus insolitus]MDC3425073.1 DUF1934 domain-containing protein [Terrihalobacillus insolitus]
MVQKIPVSIDLTTEIRELDHVESITIEESGTLIKKGNINVLTFVEHREEAEDILALITIQPGKVSVKRSGGVEMHQVFKRKQTTENVYRHEYGTLHMETYTDQISYHQLGNQKKGELFVSYQVKLNGEQKRKHRLTLSFKEETKDEHYGGDTE